MGNTDTKPIKKRVLFLLEAFDKGGIEKVTLDIVNNLNPNKYDITVQTFWWGGHCQSLVNPNIKVLPFFFKKYVKGIIRLIEYLPPKVLYTLFVRGKYDIEIAASDGGAAKVISGSTNKKAKKICWVHMDVMERGSKLKEYKNENSAEKIYGKFDSIVCVSEACKHKFIQKFGDYNSILSAHNPIPDDEIHEKAKAYNPFEKNNKCVTFVSVGRLAVEKGYDRLIKASHKLVTEGYNNFRVFIVGDGEKKEQLSSLIDELSMQRYVLLEGFKANPYPYIAESDFYICTSLDEAYPLSIGEALVLGVPVLGTACSGVDEWLNNGFANYGIRMANNEDGIYKTMRSCIDISDSEYKTLKDNAADKSKTMSMKRQMDEWIITMQME